MWVRGVQGLVNVGQGGVLGLGVSECGSGGCPGFRG